MSKTPIILGISGKMGSGKDFMVENVIVPFFSQRGLRVSQVCFADQLKVEVASKFNFPLEKMFGDKTPEIRNKLQIYGTEEGRDKYHPDIWINATECWIKLRHMRGEADVFVIADCRFKNEAAWFECNNNLLIRLNAADRTAQRMQVDSGGDQEVYEKIKNHRSEIDLDNFEFKNVVDNTCENMENSAKDFQRILTDKYT